jgi:Domain of Unknown Function (DUF928)
MKHSSKRMLFIAPVAGLILSSFFALPTSAQIRDIWTPIKEAIDRMNPFRRSSPQPIRRSPGNGTSGGPRDLCPITPYPLTSFVLPTNEPGKIYDEPIATSHPSFWFYIPYISSMPDRTSRRLEFVLLGQDEQIVYEQRFFLPKTTGVMSVSLPPSLPGLQEGQRYRWIASVICNPSNRAGDATINGWVERVKLSPMIRQRLSESLQFADKTLLYAEQQFWYETVSAIARPPASANLSTTNAQNLQKSLLKEVNLPEETPFLGEAIPAPPDSLTLEK